MMDFKFITILLIICFVALLISGAAFFFSRHRAKKKRALGLGASSSRAQMALFYQRSYTQFMKVPIVRRHIERIKLRLANINPYDELTLRRETMRITLWTLTLLFLGVVAFALISQSLVGTLFAIMGAILLNSLLITVFVKRVEDRLLVQFTNFLEEMRHEYQDSRMIDEAMYRAAQVSPHEIKLQIEKIHRILTSKDPKKELDAFYSVAPNRYLKIFAGVSHLVMEHGDKNIEKGSMYLNALNKLVRDIRDDIMRRRRLSYRLSNLTFIALIPILMTFPIELWAKTFFPVMRDFYDGKIGYILRLVIDAASIIFYLLVRKVSELEDARYIAPVGRRNWEKKVYQWPIVKAVVERIVPGKRTTKRFRVERLLKESNSPLIIEWFYIQRIAVSLACFSMVVVLSIFLHWNASHHILHDPTLDQTSLVGSLTPKEAEQARQRTNMDNQVIQDLKGVDKVSRNLIRDKIIEVSADPKMDSSVLNTTISRIQNKMWVLDNEYFKWWELLLAFGFGVVGFFAPYWMVVFQRKMRIQEMQNEVDHFHTLISILAEFERSSAGTILEWMERYAIIFKPALQKCLNNFDRGAERALAQLKEEAPFGSFIKIANRLIRAVEKISVKEAFDDLEMQQEYHREQKIERMNRLINKKVFLGRIFGWSPIAMLVGLFLLFPMLYVSFKNMGELMSQLQNLT